MFPKDTLITVKSVQNFTQLLRTTHQPPLQQMIQFRDKILASILSQPSQLIHQYRPHLVYLYSVLQYRINKEPSLVQVYKMMMYDIIDLLQKKVGCQYCCKLPYDQAMNLKMKYFEMMVHDMNIKKQNPSDLSLYQYEGRKYEMSQLIWTTKLFSLSQQIIFQNYLNKEKDNLKKKKDIFMIKAKTGDYMNLSCIGCTQFMYQNWNIQVNKVTKTDIIAIESISQDIYQIKKSICALVNSNGGVIVFNCKKKFMDIIVQGKQYTEEDKEKKSQTFSSYLSKGFVPHLTFQKNAQLRFVPVVKNPLQSEDFNLERRQYIKGLYVPVLKIWKQERDSIVIFKDYGTKRTTQINGSKRQFYEKQDEQFVFVRKQGQTIKLEGRELIHYIKNNFNTHYIPEEYAQFTQKQSHSFSNHTCTKPDKGIPITKKSSSMKLQLNPYHQKQKYKNVSMLLMYNHEKQIVKCLKQKKIDFKIIKPQQLLPFSKHWQNFIKCLFFYNEPQKSMIKIIANLKLQKQNKSYLKNPCIISLQHDVIIERKLQLKQFQFLYLKLTNINKNQQLKFNLLKGLNSNQKYSLETSSPVSMYFLFHQLEAKSLRNNKIQHIPKQNKIKIYDFHNIDRYNE